MPKSPKVSQRDASRHNPLAEEYVASKQFKEKAPKKRKSRHDEQGQDNVVDTKASRKILSLGKDLADEDEAEHRTQPAPGPSPFDFFRSNPELDEEDDQNAEAWEDEDEDQGDAEETDPADLDIFNKFNPPDFDDPLLHTGLSSGPPVQTESRNLADIILAKIAQAEAGQTKVEQLEDFPEEEVVLNPKVEEVYTKIGHLLSRYRSGKLPKAFKIIPTLPPATQGAVIPLTRPDKWTPQAIYQATRIFISGPPVTALAFCQGVLLERVREDIAENRKLNVHLYDSLRKSLYKPAAFFKGVLFPLLSSGSATLKEAAIFASVLQRVSVPVVHSAAALSRLCDIAAEQMTRKAEAAGPTNTVLRALLEKRYALPYQTVDALVFHFLRFRPMEGDEDYDGKLPVIWHQCLLVFAQRYRNEISEEQREALLDLLLVRGHKQISPEIRRELLAGRGRGTLAENPLEARGDGDDTLMSG